MLTLRRLSRKFSRERPAKPLNESRIMSVQIPEGSNVSVETREIDGDFQQRVVITGPWESAEKPSGLL